MPSYRSLARNHDFTALWIGQTVSEIGSRMTMFVFPLITYAMSGSAVLANDPLSIPSLKSLLHENSAGNRPAGAPLLLVQGTADTTIPRVLTDAFATKMSSGGGIGLARQLTHEMLKMQGLTDPASLPRGAAASAAPAKIPGVIA